MVLARLRDWLVGLGDGSRERWDSVDSVCGFGVGSQWSGGRFIADGTFDGGVWKAIWWTWCRMRGSMCQDDCVPQQ